MWGPIFCRGAFVHFRNDLFFDVFCSSPGVTTDGRSLRHTATFAASCVAVAQPGGVVDGRSCGRTPGVSKYIGK